MTRDLSQHQDRCYMGVIESELNRGRSTIRTWERMGWLPAELEFNRDEQGWRYWTRSQLEQAKAWVNRPGRRSGPTTAAA